MELINYEIKENLTNGWSFLQAFRSSLSLPMAIPDMSICTKLRSRCSK